MACAIAAFWGMPHMNPVRLSLVPVFLLVLAGCSPGKPTEGDIALAVGWENAKPRNLDQALQGVIKGKDYSDFTGLGVTVQAAQDEALKKCTDAQMNDCSIVRTAVKGGPDGGCIFVLRLLTKTGQVIFHQPSLAQLKRKIEFEEGSYDKRNDLYFFCRDESAKNYATRENQRVDW